MKKRGKIKVGTDTLEPGMAKLIASDFVFLLR
jgi:hypothetical protein